MTRNGTHAPVSGVTIIVSAYAHHQGQFLYLVPVLNNSNQNTAYLFFFNSNNMFESLISVLKWIKDRTSFSMKNIEGESFKKVCHLNVGTLVTTYGGNQPRNSNVRN